MARADFENLQVYQLAERLADEVWDMVVEWQPLARSTVGGQMIRSVDSIGANIAEGAGRGSYNDNRRFVRIARGSLNETIHWLRRAYRRSLLKPEQVKQLQARVAELGPRLNAYLNSIGERRAMGAGGPKGASATDNGPLTMDQGVLISHCPRRLAQRSFILLNDPTRK